MVRQSDENPVRRSSRLSILAFSVRCGGFGQRRQLFRQLQIECLEFLPGLQADYIQMVPALLGAHEIPGAGPIVRRRFLLSACSL